jgi:hypothetical protein
MISLLSKDYGLQDFRPCLEPSVYIECLLFSFVNLESYFRQASTFFYWASLIDDFLCDDSLPYRSFLPTHLIGLRHYETAVVAMVSYRSLIKITFDFAVRSSSLHFLIFSTVLHQPVKTRKREGSLAKVRGCYFTFQPYRKVSNIRNIATEEGAVINVALGWRNCGAKMG